MANEFVQTMADARVDAKSLSEFIFKPTGFMVSRRLAPPINTLQYYIDTLENISIGGEFNSAKIASLTVSTGAAGTNASVVTGGTPSNRTFALTIPRGDTGANGANGKDGKDGKDGSFTQKAYTTEALMIADKANIPANTSVAVTNDPVPSKNGTYAYNGTVFTKSAYDPLTQAETMFTKKQNGIAYKGIIPVGTTSLSTVTEAGYYYISASQMTALTDKPIGFTQTTAFMDVKRLGDFVQQYLYSIDLKLTDSIYYRKNQILTDSSVTVGSWADKTVNVGAHADRGAVVVSESVPISSLRLSGSYIITSVLLAEDKPSDYLEDAALVDVATYGNFVMQTFSSSSFASTKKWRRFIRPSTNAVYDWLNISKSDSVNNIASKKIVFLGDSITANGVYPTKTAELLGAAEVVIGVGGSDMTELTSPDPQVGLCGVDIALAVNTDDYTALEASPAYNINKATVDRLKALDWSTVDYVVCFWGTNDYAHGKPIGVAAEKNRTSIKGAINYITDKLVSKYPHLKLIWLTPMYRSRIGSGDGKNSEDFPNKSGIWSTEYATAITTEASRLGTPSYNLYENGSINKYNSALYLSDGLHPSSPSGYNLLAGKVAAAISSNF